jgi:hypothetical protein
MATANPNGDSGTDVATVTRAADRAPTLGWIGKRAARVHLGGERLGARTMTAYRLGAARARVSHVAVGAFYDIAAL